MQARLANWSDQHGVPPPDSLLSADGAPSPAMMAWCQVYWVTLDFAFLGASPERCAPEPAIALPDIWDKFLASHNDFFRTTALPGNGDCNTPEMLEIITQMRAAETGMRTTKPATLADVQAQLKFVAHEMTTGSDIDHLSHMLSSAVEVLEVHA